jgi:hypothetical protein
MPPRSLGVRARERERLLEEPIERLAVVLPLDERRSERVPQHRALHPDGADGGERVHRFRHGHVDVVDPEPLDEREDATPHAVVLARQTARSDTKRTIQGTNEKHE